MRYINLRLLTYLLTFHTLLCTYTQCSFSVYYIYAELSVIAA